MSLVGPRPLIIEEDRHIVGHGRRRLDLTPGLTGLWQVMGRSDIPFAEMVTLDYLYVTNWSLWGDLKLLARTMPAVTRGRGALLAEQELRDGPPAVGDQRRAPASSDRRRARRRAARSSSASAPGAPTRAAWRGRGRRSRSSVGTVILPLASGVGGVGVHGQALAHEAARGDRRAIERVERACRRASDRACELRLAARERRGRRAPGIAPVGAQRARVQALVERARRGRLEAVVHLREEGAQPARGCRAGALCRSRGRSTASSNVGSTMLSSVIASSSCTPTRSFAHDGREVADAGGTADARAACGARP